MDERFERLIEDNPNLSHSALARFTGLTKKQVFAFRKKKEISPNWFHKAVGIPFMSQFVVDGSTIAWRIECNSRGIYSSSMFDNVMDNLDRLIYALDNGGLPPTRKESYFIGLEFAG